MDDHLRRLFDLATRNPKNSYRAFHRAIRIAIISFLRKDFERYDHPNASSPQSFVEVYSHVFTAGDVEIPLSDVFPNADRFKDLHKSSCPSCSTYCSGHTVYNLLKFGWDPTFVRRPLVKRPRLYEYDKCHKSVDNELQLLVDTHKLLPVVSQDLECIVPIKIVVKTDHYLAASKLLDLSLEQTETLGSDRVNLRLAALGHAALKTRLVTDFRAGIFNDALEDFPFAYATIHDAVTLSYRYKDPFFCKFDFASYFMQIPLAETAKKYFGIQHDHQSYMFTCLPFGVKSAPAIASLITSELVQLAKRRYDINAVAYIDDVIIVSDGIEQSNLHMNQFIELTTMLNFKLNMKKLLTPTKVIEFLGYNIDASKNPTELFLSREKLELAKQKVVRALKDKRLSYSALSSLSGTLLYLSEIIFLGWAHTLPLWNSAKGITARTRGKFIKLDEIQINLLNWWNERLKNVDHMVLPSTITFPLPSCEELFRARRIFTDASGNDGFGIHNDDNSLIISQPWPVDLLDVEDMLTKELYPFVYFMTNCASEYQGKIIVWLCDNAAAAMTLNGQAARNTIPNNMIMDILIFAKKWDIKIIPIWIPRRFNVFADLLSHTNKFL